MNVTRNVIVDLLPAYAAGESHPDSARLVEHWLASDPTLDRELAALRGVDRALGGHRPTALAGHELRALQRTRTVLRMRSTLLGIALFFSLLPFSFTFDDSGVHWLMLGNPGLAMVYGALAVAGWLGWFLFAARIRVRSGV